MSWTPERTDALVQMWVWGIGSGNIAKSLGDVTRHAVMGKINRLKLMGRGGEHIGRRNPRPPMNGDVPLTEKDIADSVAEIFNEPYDVSHVEDRNAAVALTCLLVGHDAASVKKVLGYDEADIEQAIDDMHDTGVWLRNTPPPHGWWHHKEGNMSFLLDMMASARMIMIAPIKGERAYGPIPEGKARIGSSD